MTITDADIERMAVEAEAGYAISTRYDPAADDRQGLDENQVRQSHVAFRAAVHGFAHLEARGVLPADSATANDDFDLFVALFAAGLRSIAGLSRRGRKGRS